MPTPPSGQMAPLISGGLDKAVAHSQTAQPYLGIYNGAGANDPFLGLGLPPNTVFFTGLSLFNKSGSNVGQTNGAGMFFTPPLVPALAARAIPPFLRLVSIQHHTPI